MVEERYLYLSPEKLAFIVTPHRTIGMRLDYPPGELGLAPGIRLAMEMSPTEARNVAGVLLRKADEAEAGLPRA
jgi:hypothetical protein